MGIKKQINTQTENGCDDNKFIAYVHHPFRLCVCVLLIPARPHANMEYKMQYFMVLAQNQLLTCALDNYRHTAGEAWRGKLHAHRQTNVSHTFSWKNKYIQYVLMHQRAGPLFFCAPITHDDRIIHMTYPTVQLYSTHFRRILVWIAMNHQIGFRIEFRVLRIV